MRLTSDPCSLGFEVVGPADSPSPVIHIRLNNRDEEDPEAGSEVLQDITDKALKDSRVLFTVHKTSGLDKNSLPSTIRCCTPK